MKKTPSLVNITPPENVNISPEDRERAARIEESPELMLYLVDMIFGFDYSRVKS